MAKTIEIERKFIVDGDYKDKVDSSYDMIQGYLFNNSEVSIRIRICGDEANINIKKPINGSLIEREEWEINIDIDDAKSLLSACNKNELVEKTRHTVKIQDLIVEVDEFKGLNKGLVLAEIELSDKDAPIPDISWFGREVSEDIRYTNAYLSEHPFSTW
ncbi:MAG: CYTH domain-containing protein [Bacteroidales bacterium]|jgi:adenylate cyclase